MEFRYSLTTLIRNPVFTAAVVVLLAGGIGASTAIFGVIDRLFIRPLPFPNQDRIVSVGNAWPLFQNSSGDGEFASQSDDAFEAVARYDLGRVTLGGETAPEAIRLARTSRSFFSILGVGARIGYYFSAEHDSHSDKVAVLSHDLWRTAFNQDPAVVGRQIIINGGSFTVIGIMPSDFLFLVRGREADAWIPLIPDDPLIKSAQQEGAGTLARLKPGLTLEQAQARTHLVFERIMKSQPQLNLAHDDRMLLIPLRDYWFGNLRSPLCMLLGAAACLLLIACGNTTSLMVARSARRQKDMAIRAALGAGRIQIMRQLLMESLLLGILGCVLGLLFSYWATKAMVAVSPTPLPHPDEVGINLRVMAFAFAVSIPAAIIPGLISAWRVSRTSLRGIVNVGAQSSGFLLSPRLRKSVVISEVAITVLVLINAGLLFRSLRALLQGKTGFESHNVLTLEIAPVATRYPDGPKRSALYQQIIDRVSSLPGVAHVGTVNYLPMFSGSFITPVDLQEYVVPPELAFSWSYRVASSDYFNTMRIPVIEGRSFSQQDGVDAPRVAILDQSAAAFLNTHFFPNESVLGKHLVLNLGKPTSFKIIGVVGDIKQQGLDIAGYPGFYVHSLQRPPAVSNLVVRTTSDPASISGVLRKTILEIDKDLPVSDLRLMEKQVSDSLSRRRFGLLLTSILGTGALLLAMVGLYSLMSHIVSDRTHEIGVRMALGASAHDVLKLILKQALGLVVVGIMLGILVSLATARLIASLLFGVRTTDAATIAWVTFTLIIVALIACYVPVRRAMKIDPIEALRYE